MSLNAHDRQALAQIEEELAGADPQLAAELASFARSADGMGMPERERIRGSRRSVIGRAIRLLRLGQSDAYKAVYWIFLATAVSVVLAAISFALVSRHPSSGGACPGWQVGTCAKQVAPSAPVPSGHKDRHLP